MDVISAHDLFWANAITIHRLCRAARGPHVIVATIDSAGCFHAGLHNPAHGLGPFKAEHVIVFDCAPEMTMDKIQERLQEWLLAKATRKGPGTVAPAPRENQNR